MTTPTSATSLSALSNDWGSDVGDDIVDASGIFPPEIDALTSTLSGADRPKAES